jgi:hypothetical protein
MVVDFRISRIVPRPPRGEGEATVPCGQGLSLDADAPRPQARLSGVRPELIGRLALFLNENDRDQPLDEHLPAMAEDLNSQGPTTQSFGPGLANKYEFRA